MFGFIKMVIQKIKCDIAESLSHNTAFLSVYNELMYNGSILSCVFHLMLTDEMWLPLSFPLIYEDGAPPGTNCGYKHK